MKDNNKFDIDIQSFDLREYLFKILSHWKLFVLAIASSLVLAKIVNLTAERIYNLKSVITVKEEQNPLFTSSTNIMFNWGGASDKVETIMTILQSRSHNEKVVKKLNFTLDYFIEGRFRKIDVYGKTPFTIETDTLSSQLINTDIQLSFLNNNEVRISFKMDDELNMLYNYRTLKSKNFVPDELEFDQVFPINRIIESPFFRFKIIILKEQLNLKGRKYIIRFNNFDKVVKKYQLIKASNEKRGTSIIELSFNGSNKQKIEDFLNTTVQILDSDQRRQKIKYAVRTREYIDTLFEIESSSLRDIESDLGDFKQQNNIYDLSAEGNALLSEITFLDQDSQKIQNRLMYLNNLENYLLSSEIINSEMVPAPALVDMEDPNIVTSVNNLIMLAKTREGLEKKVKPSYPPLIRVNEEIKLESQILLEQIRSLKSVIRDNLESINRRRLNLNSKLQLLSPKEQKLLNFQRKYNITEANYNYLKQKSYEAGTAIASNVSDIKILDPAKDVGQRSIKPKQQYNYMVALLFGFLIPLLFVVIKEALNNKYQTTEEIEKSLKIPVLGVVARTRDYQDRLVVVRRPNSTIAESFRALRSNIQFLFQNQQTSKTVLVTSSVSGEGKTLCAENMATVFALGGKKTILLGLDLRKPKMHTDFNADNRFGMVNYLIGEKPLEEIIQKTEIPNLEIITSGPVPPNPSELLISERTLELFEILKERYDYIIIDTPPVGLVADSLELFKYSDAIMYLIRQNYTHRGMPKMIDTKYENGEVKSICYVLNAFEAKSSYGGGYGYGYGYGKYGNGYHQNEKLGWKERLRRKLLRKS